MSNFLISALNELILNDMQAVLDTANFHSSPQPQNLQNSNSWSTIANPQVCDTFEVIFCISTTTNEFLFQQTLLLFFPGLTNKEDL